ncbi:hypothetical protein ACQQ2N_06180 [Dokdonella sp. MW10]|uniref:hypothetical protein n=1 Tax=Dokdonella sp. MW10 TaxID=2992926 RepID=UPI003F80404C
MEMTLVLVMALSAGTPPVVSPASICVDATGNDAKMVTWLRGDYRVIGSRGGRPYVGEITMSGAEDAESLDLTGTVDGSPRKGSVRHVRCGLDHVRQLAVTLATGEALYCVPHYDYDNANRASCSSGLGSQGGDLELWAQRF